MQHEVETGGALPCSSESDPKVSRNGVGQPEEIERDGERAQFEAAWTGGHGNGSAMGSALYDERELRDAQTGQDTDLGGGLYLTTDELSDLHSTRDFIRLLRSKNLDVAKIKTAVVYEYELESLQIELVKLQRWIQEQGKRLAILFEGRDAAGKGGTIRRFIEHLNPRAMRVVALPAPTELHEARRTKLAQARHRRRERNLNLKQPTLPLEDKQPSN